jgi:DNA-directed RNA polymerase alpha subunit
MNTEIIIHSDNKELTFTLSNVNVSIANAIRRTILSDIPIIVFRTTPNDKNKSNIIQNTTRFNNEIIKQRLSCIPIHIDDIHNFHYKNYIMELNVENNTETILNVSTKDFTIKNIVSNEIAKELESKEIFPPNSYTGDFIHFLRLRPNIGNGINGEKIHLTCEFDIGSANEDSCFNVVSTCAYGNTIDKVKQDNELSKKIQAWKNENKTKDEIDFEIKNWKCLEGKRIYKPNSFDFVIESIGIYTNYEIVNKACEILIEKLNTISSLIDSDDISITQSNNTINNSYDIKLINEDYTIGKVIEYFFYNKFYENMKILSFCGFKKEHPHDNYSIITISYNEVVELVNIKGNFKECLHEAIELFTSIKNKIKKNDK